MARLPEATLPSVAPIEGGAAYERIQADPNSFGAAVGGALKQVGQGADQLSSGIAQVAIGQQERFNQVATDSKFTDLQNGIRALTFGDPNDPTKRGFYQMMGREALDNYRGKAQEVEDLRTKIADGLSNPAQRVEFDTMSRRYQSLTLDAMGRHADQQSKVWGATVQKAVVDTQMQDIGNNWNNPVTFANGLEQARGGAVRHLQELYGPNVDPVMVQSELNKVTSQAVTARVLAWGAQDAGGAAAWLKSGTVPEAGTGKMIPVAQAVDAHTYATLQAHLEAKGDQQIGGAAAAAAYGGSGSTGSAGFADRIIQRESGNTPGATDPGSSAAGYGGFIKSTWLAFAATHPEEFQGKSEAEILAMRSNRDLTAKAINWYAGENAKGLQIAGIPPTSENLAIAHVGLRNAVAIIKADPNAPASSVLPAQVITANPTWGKMTAGQLVTVLGAAGQGVAMPNAAAPPGATNNAPDHTTDRAVGYANLLNQLQNGQLNEKQFSIALTRLQQMQQIDAKVKSDAAEQAFNEYIPQALKAPGAFNMDTMLSDARLTGLQKNQIFSIVNRALKGDIDKPTEVSQAKRTELLDGIRAGTVTTPNQLVDAVAHGGLSTSDYNFVRQRFDEAQTDNGRSLNKQTTELFGAVEKDITATIIPGLNNPSAGLDFYRWKNFAYARIAEAQKDGKGVARLFDPASSDFLGARDVLDKFRATLDEVTQQRIGRMGGAGGAGGVGLPRAQEDTGRPEPAFNSLVDVQKAVSNGIITRDRGIALALQNGWIRPKVAPTPATAPQVPTTSPAPQRDGGGADDTAGGGGDDMPAEGLLEGEVHTNKDLAPSVPEGAPRPLAPGEWVQNPSGSWSSEISTTVTNPNLNDGKPTIIPSLWIIDGKPIRVSEAQAVAYAKQSGLHFRSFETIAEAEDYATKRESQWQGIEPSAARKIDPLWTDRRK